MSGTVREPSPMILLLRAGEAPGVPHVRPHIGLHVAKRLAQMVAIVVDPLVHQVLDRKPSHLRMGAATLELLGPERPDELNAVAPELDQLLLQLFGISGTVVPLLGDPVTVPCRQVRFVGGEDEPDAAGEAVVLSFDHVTDDLFDAPLSGGWMP